MVRSNKTYQLALAMIAISLISSCNSNIKFTPQALPSIGNDSLAAGEVEINESFKITDSQQAIVQESLEQNVSTVSFQVKKSDGQYVQNLNPADLTLIENSINVPDFKLTKNTLEYKQTVDIAFAVDVTGSMTSTIESAKVRLINFVRKSREAGYHTRMCLITFGDYTVQKCDKFYDNNPDDPATLAQVEELVSEISKLKALKGSQDPGGKDLNENPMRAVIDAANADWAVNNQRFLILITDDGFLYSPGNQGAVGSVAPRYSDVKEALSRSQIKVFAATPSLAGYNKNFGSEQSIVTLSGGEWFNFSDLISGKITLDTILNRIITSVNTTFVAEYIVDSVENLDASLPVAKRKIEIQLKDSSIGSIQTIQLKSNLPNGRESYKSEFPLTSKKIKKDTVKVTVNGVEIKNGYSIVDGKIKFNKAPVAGSKINVTYKYSELKDAVSLKPIYLNNKVDPNSVIVVFNGIQAKASDYTVEKSIEGIYSLVLNDSVLAEADPYQIFANNGLQIHVKYSNTK